MKEVIKKLIKNTSTTLPYDIIEALFQAEKNEEGSAKKSLETILENQKIALKNKTPICQDTGFPTFWVYIPDGYSQINISQDIKNAVIESTKEGTLRPNSVDSITGKNTGDNTGIDIPKIYFIPTEEKNITIKLLLKGGGSENVSDQICLPTQTDFGKAGRNLEGVKNAVLQVVKNAQGKGCAPGILGIHIGSDRAGGYIKSKENLLLPLDNENIQEELKKLEVDIIQEANKLNIGPMGFGGKNTILGAHISSSHRIPASFFVTVSYGCWAMRRGEIYINTSNKIISSSHQDISPFLTSLHTSENTQIKELQFPITSEDQIKDLKVGDIVKISGEIFTGRDEIHQYVMKNTLPIDISNSAIYHCGPVALYDEKNKKWNITAAGPTTSAREEIYQSKFIKKTGIKAVIGKGGMGEKTSQGLKENNAVYLHAIGGAAAFYAQCIKNVKGVEFLEEFGIPEAMWKLEVQDFLTIVTMDSHGKSLHKN